MKSRVTLSLERDYVEYLDRLAARLGQVRSGDNDSQAAPGGKPFRSAQLGQDGRNRSGGPPVFHALHRELQPAALHVREQLSGGRGVVLLSGHLECVQAAD